MTLQEKTQHAIELDQARMEENMNSGWDAETTTFLSGRIEAFEEVLGYLEEMGIKA